MKLFAAYIRQRRGLLLALFLFVLIFFASFLLYQLPLSAVLYPVVLCAALGGLLLAGDFFQVRKKHRRLEGIRGLANTADPLRPAGLAGSLLPEAGSLEEADYQAIIAGLQAELAGMEAKTDMRFREMMDYYTMWVHQIKTPVASMKLSLQNEDTPFSRKLSLDLLRIEQYVGMVLAYLRLDSVSSDYVFREYEMDALIRQAVKKFAPEFIDRKLKLEYTPVNLSLITDEKWFLFLLEQLLSNALKYTREGSVRIYRREPKTLCIEDTGIGIAPEDLPRIFEKGYTGGNGRRDKQASGIGLYLCKRICKNLGLTIEVESEPEKGTAVCIDLEQENGRKD